MAKPEVRAFDVPFREQAEFWRRKVNVPTAGWRDLQRDDHAHGFMVAGAARQDLLDDLRKAVDKAVVGGGTIADFRRDFDAIVERTGWQYKGGRNWRTRIIYETNVRSAYQAGRWTQMQAIKHRRPFWQYVHNDSVVHPRPQHLAWNGIVLRADDGWWSTHFCPNGYGCKCTVITLAQRDLVSLGKSGPDAAPTAVDDTEGLDPGFDYNVGVAASSMPAAVRLGQKVMAMPSAWRNVALADAQQRPTDLFADWPAAVTRALASATPERGAARALGFLRPQVASALEEGKALDGVRFDAIKPSTALLGAQDAPVIQAAKAATGDLRDTMAAALTELPQRLADPATLVLWDSGELVYAWRLDDGRYMRAAFRVDARPTGATPRKAELLAHWLASAEIVEDSTLVKPGAVRLAGEAK